MEILCTRPTCGASNHFPDLDDPQTLKTTQQKYCTTCGMPLILGGRYIPTKLLGKGGFGAAFLARDRYTMSLRDCVVKQFLPAGDLTPEQLEIAQGLFEREAHVLEEIGNEHKQIPDSYAFFPLIARDRQAHQDKQFFYLVQEYINGQDLEQEMAEQGHYSEAEVLSILREVLQILTFVHSRDVIHRDIKPSNIMRSRKGRLYLLDFGAVKQVATMAGNPQGRSTGIYSLGFAPPEQMQGSQVYPSTDLYALAATCLVLLTGEMPEKLFDTYHNCWSWKHLAPHVSNELAAILDRMLLSTPRDRYPSAQEVLMQLNQLQGSQTQHHPIRNSTNASTVSGSYSANSSTSLQSAIPSTPPSPQHAVTLPPSTPPAPAPNAPQPAITQPPPPVPATPGSPIPQRQPQFSLADVLGSAAFTGFEGSLLLMACLSVGGPMLVVWGMGMGMLVYLQVRRILEGKDFVIFGILTLGLVAFVPFLHSAGVLLLGLIGLGDLMGVGFLGVLGGAAAVMVTAIFRLIYQVVAGWFS